MLCTVYDWIVQVADEAKISSRVLVDGERGLGLLSMLSKS